MRFISRKRLYQEEFTPKMIRQLTTSPDGKFVAFNAAGYIYLKELPKGDPVRIDSLPYFQYDPSFSPDGKSLVYVSWSDELKGRNKTALTLLQNR